MTDQERIDRAHRDAAELRGFYSHLTLYVGVMLLLALVDAATGRGWWVQWPALGWGVGIVSHMVAMAGKRWWGPEWEERKVADMLAREAGRAPGSAR